MEGTTVDRIVRWIRGQRPFRPRAWIARGGLALWMAAVAALAWAQSAAGPQGPGAQPSAGWGQYSPPAVGQPFDRATPGPQPGYPGTPGPQTPLGLSAQPAPPAPVAPFQLTPEQQAQVDRVLKLWEEQSAQVKTFRCSFKRWVWDPVFGPPDRPKFEDLGTIRYAAPDKGLFQVEKTIVNGQAAAVQPERAEHWVCNGQSVFEYNHARRQVIEYPLPPELRGQAITNGPLPFLFGARAEDLRRRYFLRIITPPDLQGKQIWLEAWPRFQGDAANFQRAHLVLSTPGMTPFALNVYSPNGKGRTAYQFYDIKTNEPSWWLGRNPFEGAVPFGWQKVVEQPAPVEAQQPAVVPRG